MKYVMRNLVAAVLLHASAAAVEAQSSGGCLAAAPDSVYAYKLLALLTADDSSSVEARARLGLVVGTMQDIAVVADTSLCRRAAEAYDNSHVAFFGTTSQLRQVYLFRLQDVYVVIDPDVRSGHYSQGFVYSDSLVYRGGLLF